MSLKTSVESLLFALGRRTTADEIARILHVRDVEKIVQVLDELKAEYDQKQGSIVITKEDGAFKMTVRDDLLPVVRRIMTKTELPKGVMETLAIIAYKAPVLQSDIVRIRTNKAYEHLALLDQLGYLSREKKGRSKLLRLSKKFFDYFDVPEADLKAKFGTVQALEQAIVDKEQEIVDVKQDVQERKEQNKVQEDAYKKSLEVQHKEVDAEIAALPEIDLIDDEGQPEKLETYNAGVVQPQSGEKTEVIEETIYDTTRRRKKKDSLDAGGSPSAPGVSMAPAAPRHPRKKEQVVPVVLGAAAVEAAPKLVALPVAAANQLRPAPFASSSSPVQDDDRPSQQSPAPAPEEDVILPSTVEAESSDAEPPLTGEDAIEAEAQVVAETASSKEGEGLFAAGASPEVEKMIDEKVDIMLGKKPSENPMTDAAPASQPVDDAFQENTAPRKRLVQSKSREVHVSAEVGEAAERGKDGEDPHAHPGSLDDGAGAKNAGSDAPSEEDNQ